MSGSSIGKNIAGLRRKHMLSQRELAKCLNVTHQAVSKWENGMAEPGIPALLAMSRLFGISVDALLSDPEGCGAAAP